MINENEHNIMKLTYCDNFFSFDIYFTNLTELGMPINSEIQLLDPSKRILDHGGGKFN